MTWPCHRTLGLFLILWDHLFDTWDRRLKVCFLSCELLELHFLCTLLNVADVSNRRPHLRRCKSWDVRFWKMNFNLTILDFQLFRKNNSIKMNVMSFLSVSYNDYLLVNFVWHNFKSSTHWHISTHFSKKVHLPLRNNLMNEYSK